MSKLVYNFKEFLISEAIKFDVHRYNKSVADPERQELREAGALNPEPEPNHHKYLRYMKMEIDDAKKYMDEMDYNRAAESLEEVESMLRMIKKAVDDAYLDKQEDEREPDEEEEVTE